MKPRAFARDRYVIFSLFGDFRPIDPVAESIKLFIEDQAILQSFDDSAPRPSPSPTPLPVSKLSPVETGEGGEEGVGEKPNQIIRPREIIQYSLPSGI
jgi:hypothetical protein